MFKSAGQYLLVTADKNDGDYVHCSRPISNEGLEKIRPVIDAIKQNTEEHNFPTSECRDGDIWDIYPQLDKQLLEYFDDNYVPYGEVGIHTIVSIKLIHVTDTKDLLKGE